MILLSSTAAAALFRPWVGVVAAYLFVILTPQSIWWWTFQDFRPVLWILLPTILGFAIAFMRSEFDFGTIRNKRTVFVFVLWIFYVLSYYFGPYVEVKSPYRFSDPGWAMSTFHKIMLLYFVACVCIDDVKKLKALVFVLIGSGIYLVYWANDMYLSGRVFGRMPGPTSLGGGGIYADGNNFAMLFVVVLPFLWHMGFLIKKRLLRWGLWLVIPFGWHAVFLTGSRGGLVGIAATMAIVVWRSKNKALAALLIPAFAIAYVWQAGDVMRDRASTISEFQSERSASARLESWEAATNMIASHPLVGVGLSSFAPAYPYYAETVPHEAHNTFFQIAAESGIIAGLMYVLIVFSSMLGIWRNGKILKSEPESDEQQTLYWINESVLVGFFGLVVCSLFLSLQMFEIFYCLCVMMNALLYIGQKRGVGDLLTDEEQNIGPTARVQGSRG